MQEVTVFLDGTPQKTITDHRGYFAFEDLEKGTYRLVVFSPGYKQQFKDVNFSKETISLTFDLKELEQELESVTIQDSRSEELGMNWLQSVSGMAIYEAKKTELILLDELIANKAANVSRQIYSRVPGLNIWENDGAGVQLGIGGRGLSPNRTSNFNVRQNGYDISADALGYPESYYTPPTQALERIEIVRGAAGLQYGTQFGGMLNFEFKEGPTDKKIEVKTPAPPVRQRRKVVGPGTGGASWRGSSRAPRRCCPALAVRSDAPARTRAQSRCRHQSRPR